MMDFICPYCFNKIKRESLIFECPDGHRKTATVMERLSGKVKCSQKGCGKVASKILCPNTMCNSQIPNDMLATPNLLFSIVGVSGSGKTNYITVMLEELSRTGGLKLALGYQNIETRNIHRKNCKLIYEDHKKPEATPSGGVPPQIWRIKNLNRQTKTNIQTYTFSIFDGAGEDHENLDLNSSQCRYIAVSEAIMIVIDPMILRSVKNSLNPAVYANSVSFVGDPADKNSGDVVNNISTYIKNISGIGVNQKINIPVAVIFSKMDALMDDFRNRPVSNSSPHEKEGCFLYSDCRAVDADIRSWLISNGESAFMNALEANFKEFTFFGVSSYGSVPKSADELYAVHPHRVLDPILWFFAKKNYIDSK
ncbi:MAG: hypothetical protein LBF78_08110 [Treponema sp.]|jgi:hypothetical protein|nr:hypothetical protein [Treponema sp.]